jgi:NADH:ubiquinone oxidoreductase subunit 6 (subunit J)
MTAAEFLLYLGAVAGVYFLVTMLLALIRNEPQATLRAWGLGVCLVLMLIAAMVVHDTAGPTEAPGPTYPPRIPGLPLTPQEVPFPGPHGQAARRPG